MSDFFKYFLSEIKIDLPSSIPTKIDQIWTIDFEWLRIQYLGVRKTSDQNSVVPKFGGGVAKRQGS